MKIETKEKILYVLFFIGLVVSLLVIGFGLGSRGIGK